MNRRNFFSGAATAVAAASVSRAALAAEFEDGERTYAAVNTGCLEERDAFAPMASTSPQRLSPEEKLARWRQLWIGEVSLQSM